MKILLIFKTHLDLGYTDLAASIERKYIDEFIPHALDLAETMKETGNDFVWTTGSWLVERFMNSSDANRARLERAVRDGLIAWHALPFTMHVEMMDRRLFERGLAVRDRLDAHFGVKTIAAKATDVPGMTRAAVPLLARAGVRMLHIGVNPVSAVPDVPPVFRWRAPDGSEIFVLYDQTYGNLIELPGADAAICFAMTNDNCGPQNPQDVKAVYRELYRKYPDAEICASTLNEAAELLVRANPDVPVVTSEIGDSWAHGYQSDPYKQAAFRLMLRYADTLTDGERATVHDRLLPTAEHTCGGGGKRFLNDDGHYPRPEFEERRTRMNYRMIESTWAEQRSYLAEALSAFEPGERSAVKRRLTKLQTPLKVSGDPQPVGEPLSVGKEITLGCFTLTIGWDGAVWGLKRKKEVLFDKTKRLFGFTYEVFSKADTLRFCEQYFKARMSWGYDDFSKRGLESAANSHLTAAPFADTVYRHNETLTIPLKLDGALNETYGCPAKLILQLHAAGDALEGTLSWEDKPASRIPEGMWMSFDSPLDDDSDEPVLVSKLGEWIDPADVVRNGGRSLHGTDCGVKLGGLTIETFDSALVSFGGGLWDFSNRLPRKGDTVRFNLYNNQWNTNFPMWYSDNARFSFRIH